MGNTSNMDKALASAERLMTMGDKILLSRHKVSFYEKALQALKDNSSKEAEDLRNALGRRIADAKAGIAIENYGHACRMQNNASSVDEFSSAASRFEEVCSFHEKEAPAEELLSDAVREEFEATKQAKSKRQECLSRIDTMVQRKKLRGFVYLTALCLAAALYLFGTSAPTFYIWAGKLEQSLGKYDKAIEYFTVAEKRQKSEKTQELLREAKYARCVAAYEKGDYAIPGKSLYPFAMEKYKDAEQMHANAEIRLLREAEVGDKVHFTDRNWIVLEKEEDKIKLMKFDASGPRAMQTEPENGDSWEASSMREFLNGAYFDEIFTDLESGCILPSRETGDYIFLLSEEEIEQYGKLVNKCGHNHWLRTPGLAEGTMKFIDNEQNLMNTGVEVENDTLYFKPIMWVDISKDF